MKGNQGFKQGRPQPRPRKECRFKVPKTSPFEMATCNTKIGKDGNISRVHCQNLEGAKVQLFEAGKRKSIIFYSHFQKLHLCTLNFLYLLFLQIKAIKLPRTPSNKDSAKVRENHSRSQQGCKLQMPQLHKLCLHAETCTFIFVLGGKGGMLGLSLAACASLGMQEVAFLDLLLFLGKGNNLP